jgi:5-methylcytosine-specific restriction endonuclease McrA
MYTITYLTLKEKYGSNGLIPYSELLMTREWSDCREHIIKRDKHSCTECGKGATDTTHKDELSGKTYYLSFGGEYWERNANRDETLVQDFSLSHKPYCLQVHHKFYILENLPWEYRDEDLITLCNWCHTFHEHNTVSGCML